MVSETDAPLPLVSIEPEPIISPITSSVGKGSLSPHMEALHNRMLNNESAPKALLLITAISLISHLCQNRDFASSSLKIDISEVIPIKRDKNGVYRAGFASLLFSSKNYSVVDNFVNPKLYMGEIQTQDAGEDIHNRILSSIRRAGKASIAVENPEENRDSVKWSGNKPSDKDDKDGGEKTVSTEPAPSTEKIRDKQRSSIGAFSS